MAPVSTKKSVDVVEQTMTYVCNGQTPYVSVIGTNYLEHSSKDLRN
jgi:hypothetical protein